MAAKRDDARTTSDPKRPTRVRLAVAGPRRAAPKARAPGKKRRSRRSHGAHSKPQRLARPLGNPQGYRQLFDGSPLPMWIFDIDTWRFLEVNEAACDVYGYSREEFLAMTLHDIRPSEDVPAMEWWLRTSNPRVVSSAVWRHRKKDGTIFRAEVASHEARYEGRVARYACAVDVTQRLKDQERIRKLSQAVEQSPAATAITDTEGCIEYVNAKFIEVSGYPAEELIGNNPRVIQSGLTPPAVYEDMWTTIKSGADWHGIVRNRRKNGELYWESEVISPVKNERGEVVKFIAVKEDITARVEAEERLRESERRFRQLTEAIQEVFFLVDPSGAPCYYVSPAYEQIWGRSCRSMYDDPYSWAHAIVAEDRERTLQAMAPGGEFVHFDVEYRIALPDGSLRWIHAKGFPILDDTGKPFRVAAIAEDVTARRSAEQAVIDLNADLERRVAERTAELEAANKELEAFDYSIAHDLRSPLARIRGFGAAVLKDNIDKLDSESVDYLRRMVRSAESMEELVGALLRLSMTSRQELARKDIDVSAQAHLAFEALRRVQPERKAELVLAPGLRARADPGLFGVVLENLIGNAWKFTSRRESARIEVGATLHDGRQAFFVRDNGAGFDPAYADKLFAPLQRLHTKDEFPGSGIGLATVHRIVLRHGGQIWAEGAVGQGATFYFTLSP